ncbi:bifunctional DNA primase/polymerase [Lentzea jiangxiensis]|uniref:bifunctional DNA primase/polymerase n=1 Tax=Lentzea jiangxiensis TaxID=641025 RepID=UPI0024812065|nr:bifunctional DNA primase/polymerase [Lentzea jiangxiensis]
MAAAARGWPVVPARPDGKVPILTDWDHTATTNRAQIIAWWAAAPYNIALSCRRAGLVVIDLDPAHGTPPPEQWARRGAQHGRDVLRLLAHDLGEPDPTDTYTVLTPSGGEHRYFHAPHHLELHNTAGTLGWRIDTRAHGGSIIAAGSTRRLEGRTRLYRPVQPIQPVAVLPLWLATALTPPPAPAPAIGLTPALGNAHAYVAAAVRGETATVHNAQVGTRARTLFVSAIKLGQLVGAGCLHRTDAITALLTAAAGHEGVDGWTRAESLHHIKNGLARGVREPRVISTPCSPKPRQQSNSQPRRPTR